MKLSKKVKNSILLILGFFITWYLFLFWIGETIFIMSDEDEVFEPMVKYMGLGIVYLLIVLVVVIVCCYSKVIDETYRIIICCFPFITIIFNLPMLYLVLRLQVFFEDVIKCIIRFVL